MTRHAKRWVVGLVTASAVVLGMTGCGTSPGHEAAVNAANERWLNVRTALVLQMAQQQFDAGDLDQCERTLAEAIITDPKSAELHLLAGRIALERGQLERAFHRLSTAIECDPALPAAHYFQGIVAQRWQQSDKALACYRRAYELQADNPAFLLAVGEMLVQTDRSDEALELLASKVTYFDQNAGIRVAVGQLCMKKRDFARAVEMFQQAALLRGDDLRLIEHLATAQCAAGDMAAAIKHLERLYAHESYKDRTDLARTLAACYQGTGRSNDARKIYLELTRSEPTHVETWLKLAETCLSMDDLPGALLAANRVAALAPRRHEGHLVAGMVWQRRQNIDRALTCFDKAAQVAPQSTAPLILRGITLERAGRREAAAQAYAQALKRNPGDEQARRLLANVQTEPGGASLD